MDYQLSGRSPIKGGIDMKDAVITTGIIIIFVIWTFAVYYAGYNDGNNDFFDDIT